MHRSATHLHPQIIARELALVAVVIAIVAVPAILQLGMLSWAAIGGLLAVALVYPRPVILAIPAMIPLSFQPMLLGSFELNVLEALTIAGVVGYTPRFFAGFWRLTRVEPEERYQRMKKIIPDRFAAGIAILLIIAGIMSIIWMADATYAAESLRLARWTILVPVAFFFLIVPILRQHPDFRYVAAGLLLAGAVISSIFALIDGALGGGVQADSVIRLSGIAPHPNALALVLDRILVVGVLIGVVFRPVLARNWLIPSALVGLVLLLTFSRGSFLGVAAGILLILVVAQAGRFAIAMLGASVTAFVAMMMTAPERTLSFLGGGSGSMRIELWQSSLNMAADHVLTGVGLDQFLYQYTPRYIDPSAWPERFTSHPHNILLDSWLSLGIIGLIIIGLIGLLAYRHVRTALIVQDRVTLAAAGGLITVAVHGMVDHSYFLPELAVSAWLLVALLPPAIEPEEEVTPIDDEQSEADASEDESSNKSSESEGER
jgi:putative inorganic carbon (hco3(-)) transporter